MREWIEAQLAAGLPAFAGSHLSGTVAVTPDVLNELIARWLGGVAEPAPVAGGRPAVDASTARAFIKSAAIRAEPGRLLVDFEIRI
jgi:hypothetical protein